MAKTDVRADMTPTWDTFRDKPFDQALPEIHVRAKTAAERYAAWYWQSIRTKRNTSLAIRGAMVVLLLVGTLCPIAAGLWNDVSLRLQVTQVGVGLLALAGLLQIADRVFGWSSGWIRYITTAMAMENLANKFHLDWAGYVIDKGGQLGQADVRPLFDLAMAMQEGLARLQDEETQSWKVEFNSGAALLGDMIKQQRESNDQAAGAARTALDSRQAGVEAARQLGAIEASFSFKGAVVPVTVSLDHGPAEPFTGTTWSRLKVVPGQHQLTVGTVGDAPVVVSRVVEVKPAVITTLEVKFDA